MKRKTFKSDKLTEPISERLIRVVLSLRVRKREYRDTINYQAGDCENRLRLAVG